MTRRFILFIFLSCCSAFEQNDFIQTSKLGIVGNCTIFYRLYQTGIDNYRYEFYSIDKNLDTVDIFMCYLNDASYKDVTFNIQERNDTIEIITNWDVSSEIRTIRNQWFHLKKDSYQQKPLGFQLHEIPNQIPKLMTYDDERRSLTNLDIAIHERIWSLKEVSNIAEQLKNKSVETFTVIEEYPSHSNDHYLIKFGEILEGHTPTISFFRINKESGRIDKQTDNGDWIPID